VPLRDAQILARACRPRTTEHYDRARGDLDRHGVHFLTAYVAGVDRTRADTASASMRWAKASAGCPAIPQHAFRYTILGMGHEDDVREDRIRKWADEAEAGYDVESLKRRGRGRPGRGAEPMQVVAVRLTAEELAALDAVAARRHVSRSEAIRQALSDLSV
jgi:predicted transcriptional regulator